MPARVLSLDYVGLKNDKAVAPMYWNHISFYILKINFNVGVFLSENKTAKYKIPKYKIPKYKIP